jgi:glutaredoxin
MKLFSRVILPLLLILYIAIETYAKLNHTSICSTTGCELAGELLRFNSLYLNYFGALGALAVAFFGWLSLKREGFETLFYITLYAAIAFESIMIAFQVLANPEPCIFCLGVYGGLLAIALFSSWRYLLYAIPAIAALFISMASLTITQNRAMVTENGTYLIHSESCPHCKNVKTYFEEHAIDYQKLSVYDVNTRFFIKQLDINSIPVLVIKDKLTTKVIKGDKAIIAYYETLNKSSKESGTEAEIPEDIYKAKDDGCSASVIQQTDAGCSEDAAIPLR